MKIIEPNNERETDACSGTSSDAEMEPQNERDRAERAKRRNASQAREAAARLNAALAKAEG